jgi:serine/threonine protein kinase
MRSPDAAVSQLLEEALGLAPDQRNAFLDTACSGRPELRRQLDALLKENIPAATGFPLEVGARLGRYLLIEELGAGGMGVVYRARDEKLERIVAVKVLIQGVLKNELARAHFRREALALARLNHPNIAALYDVGEQDGVDYLVMECVQGESLRTRLLRGSLPIPQATRILIQIGEALEEAHTQGVIHRDLKPANVMLTPKGHATVLDFGVAKLLETTDATQSLVQTGTVIGTPLYMSPEQALSKNVDARTDLWSLGAVYYEMLTGKTAFHGDTVASVMRAVTMDPYPPPRQVLPDLPDGADKIIRKALEKDPEKRCATAAQMVRDAQAVLDALTGATGHQQQRSTRVLRIVAAGLTVVLVGALRPAGGCTAGWRNAAGRAKRLSLRCRP